MTHHAIIGDGLSAAELAVSAPLGRGDRLTVIGPAVARLGRGLAYADHPADAPWRFAWLLNSPAYLIDEAFVDWAAARWDDIAARMAGRRPDWLAAAAPHVARDDIAALFLPRAIFGDYLRARIEAGLARLDEAGVEIVRLPAKVTGLRRDGPAFRLSLSDGTTVAADSVDLATGGPVNQPLCAGLGAPAFETPYGNEAAIAGLARNGGPIVCIGGNAAMLDVLRLVQSVTEESRLAFSVISQTGHLPEPTAPHHPRRPAAAPGLAPPYRTAETFLAALDADIARCRAGGDRMAELQGGFYGWLFRERLTSFVPDRDEARRAATRVERRFFRGTRDSIRDFDRLAAAGRTRMVAGQVSAVRRADDGTLVVAYTTPDGTAAQMAAAAVVNTAGPGPAPRFDPLTNDLIDDGILEACPVTKGIRVGPGLETALPGLRYLSPALSEIGDGVLPMRPYSAEQLRLYAFAANGYDD